MTQDQGSQIDPGGGAGIATGSRGFGQKIKDWTRATIADALAKRDGRTSLKVNGTQIGVRQHLDVQLSGATGEDHPELDLARVVLPASGLGRCSIYLDRSTSFTFANNTNATVTLDTADIDPDGWHSGNTIVVPTAGDYLIFAHFAFDYISPGTIVPTQWDIRLYVFINASQRFVQQDVEYLTDLSTIFGKFLEFHGMLHLDANDAVSLKVYQNSGNTGTYNGSFSALQSVPRLMVVRL